MLVHSAAFAATSPPSELSAIPRQEWRRLLSPPAMAPCSQVLVAGPQPAALAGWLARLSFDVLAISDDATAAQQGRRMHPQVEFLRVSDDPHCVLPGHAFDAAFVQPMSVHGDNWLSSHARLFTAGLMAAIKPNGRLVSWRASSSIDRHEDVCWQRHLACFPGRIEAREVFDAPLSRFRRNARRTVITTWQSPSDWLSLEDWRNYARRGLLTDVRGCCATATSATALDIRRAA